jgi:hypothetical protein
MGWNLFGTPFLHTINYGDMDYGRVMYKYNGTGYVTENSNLDTKTGSLPVGGAVFTQTATLRDEEIVLVGARLPGEAIQTDNMVADYLLLEIRRAYEDTKGIAADNIVLQGVPTDEADGDFNMNVDGVKMNSFDPEEPRIYMERSGGRYSLLSAVDIEGTVDVGVYVGEAGAYEILVPDYCDASDYEVVALKDAVKNTLTDLKEMSYIFNYAEVGEINGRFSISFRKTNSELKDEITVYSPERNTLVVEGMDMTVESVIRIYDVSGRTVDSRRTTSYQETFEIEHGVYVIEVVSEVKERSVRKAYVK